MSTRTLLLPALLLALIPGACFDSSSDADADADVDIDADVDADTDTDTDTDGLPEPLTGPFVHVAVDAADTLAAEVSDKFLSVAVDTSQVVGGHWWGKDAEVEPGVGAERCDPYDFTRPRLRKLAAELVPAYIRIGGSEADKVIYDLTDDPPDEAPEPFELVFTRAQWDGVAEFATSLGFEIFFTLNAGPGTRDPETLAWTSDLAREFIRYSVGQGYPVTVWELGNEINGFQMIHGFDWRITGEQYAADVAVLRDLVFVWDPGTPTAGPSSAFWPGTGEMMGILPEFMAAGGDRLDIITWHYYPQQSQRCPVQVVPAATETMLDPANLDEVAVWAEHVEALAAEHAPDAQVWLGESGNAQCGGQPGVSDAFAGTFWWLDQLGRLARRGQQVVVRQTLSGSNYGLVQDETLHPNPDYWASVLWKRLMGTKVLATSSGSRMLRAYAHCAPAADGDHTGYAAVLINLDDDAVTVTLDPPAWAQREVFLLTGRLDADTVDLNGTTLTAAADGTLPELRGETRRDHAANHAAVRLPGTSIAYVRFPDFEEINSFACH